MQAPRWLVPVVQAEIVDGVPESAEVRAERLRMWAEDDEWMGSEFDRQPAEEETLGHSTRAEVHRMSAVRWSKSAAKYHAQADAIIAEEEGTVQSVLPYGCSIEA
jgi:hypothetical protein